MMRKILALAFLLMILSASASHADYCDQYRFGSPEWWKCKQDISGPPG